MVSVYHCILLGKESFGKKEMSIIYCIVSQGLDVLAECTSGQHSGNFDKVSRKMLFKFQQMRKDPDERERMGSKITYICDGYTFNILMDSKEDRVFMCLSSSSAGRNLPYRFLDELQNRMWDLSGIDEEARPNYISAIIEETMEEFSVKSKDSVNSHVENVIENLSDVKEVMKTNIENLLSRGDRIDSLHNRSEKLRFTATTFKKQGNALHRHMCYRRSKSIILITLVLLFLAYLVTIPKCGLRLQCWK